MRATPSVGRGALWLASTVLGLLGHPASGQLVQSQTFSCITPTDRPPIQPFVVPSGISQLQVVLQGASGSQGNGAPGGFGGYVQATFAVTANGPLKPSQTLNVWVGCFGDLNLGFGNGGDKGVANCKLGGDGGHGGGGSALTDQATQATLIVAGGRRGWRWWPEQSR